MFYTVNLNIEKQKNDKVLHPYGFRGGVYFCDSVLFISSLFCYLFNSILIDF